MLDVGCGEGWNLAHFHGLGFHVTGLEFQKDACEHFHPHLTDHIHSGDVYEMLQHLSDEKYDIIILDNVLEHVLSPEETIRSLKKIISPGGMIIIEVPNDFSKLQETAISANIIDRDFWVSPPDHLTYYSKDSLNAFMEDMGFSTYKVTCDFPIDLNLFNPATNYVMDKGNGRNVHLSRIAIENLFDEISVEKTNRLYEALADMGLGRNITGFYTLNK